MPQPPIPVAELRAADLERPGVLFAAGGAIYQTTGRRVGKGGMGRAFVVTSPGPQGQAAEAVAKTFSEELVLVLREDEVARRQFEHSLRAMGEIGDIDHPHVLPVLFCAPIVDNTLLLSPQGGKTLLQTLGGRPISPRERVRRLLEALRGLEALHARGVVHRDFTLHNMLWDGERARVFDFDLSVAPHLLAPDQRSYAAYYQGRLHGSPDFSVAPELLDPVLGAQPISPRVDVYAAGTALYALFCDDSVYGDAPDLPTLFERIVAGVVHRRHSRIRYPDDMPAVLWPVIESCLERDPPARYAHAGELASALELVLDELPSGEKPAIVRKASGQQVTQFSLSSDEVFARRADSTVTEAEFARTEALLARHGYRVEESLGRVKGNAIFLALPDPEQVADDRFPDENTYRKIVTVVDLAGRPPGFLSDWLGRIYPVLRRVRQGYLTALHKIAHEKDPPCLLLFSEWVSDPRFGSDLERHELALEEAFALGLLVAFSIQRLHAHGVGHNNVTARSLVFKGQRAAGRVSALFLGLVEPSLDPAVQKVDVQRLAALVAGWVRQGRIDALEPRLRPQIEQLRDRLAHIGAAPAGLVPTMAELVSLLSEALAQVEPNFGIVRRQGGDVAGYCDLLVRHSLYHKLYALDVSDEPGD